MRVVEICSCFGSCTSMRELKRRSPLLDRESEVIAAVLSPFICSNARCFHLQSARSLVIMMWLSSFQN